MSGSVARMFEDVWQFCSLQGRAPGSVELVQGSSDRNAAPDVFQLRVVQ